jgi:acyl-CoA synthetase (NDP forming)
MYSVEQVLNSKSVVVIGASRDPSKPGAMLLRVLRETGFNGQFAGVNPQGGEVHGVPLYRSLQEIPFDVDLAVLLIPPAGVVQALKECANKGVKGVVISSEGFAESGPQGRIYQEEVGRILKSTGMRGFGPNTLGVVNTETGLTTSYFSNERMLRPGPIGFAAQSGIFVGALLRYLSSFDGYRISKGIGLGNKVDVDESDALEYLSKDPQTRIIGMYLEDIRDGKRFLHVAREAARRKPVLLLKGGRTPQGAKVTASHTASLAVEDSVLDGALRQSGVIRLYGIDELMETLKGFLYMPLPSGDNVALVTYSGAQAIMSIDAASEVGLELAALAPQTRSRLSEVISSPNKTKNPVDLFPDMLNHGFEKTARVILEALLADRGVHAIVFICFAMGGTEPLLPMVETMEDSRKPVFFTFLGVRDDVESSSSFMEAHGIPCFSFPERGVKVLARMRRYARFIEGS